MNPVPDTDKIVLRQSRIHMPATDTDDDGITYPFVEIANELGIESEDPLHNDMDWFFPTKGIFTLVRPGLIEVEAEVIQRLKERTGRDQSDLTAELTRRLSLVLSESDEYPFLTLNLSSLARRLDAWGVSNAYFSGVHVPYMLVVPHDPWKVGYHFRRCHIDWIEWVQSSCLPSVDLAYCEIGLFVDRLSRSEDHVLEHSGHLSISRCNIEYLHSESKKISLREIPQLGLTSITHASDAQLDFTDVRIRYDSRLLRKYSSDRYVSALLPSQKLGLNESNRVAPLRSYVRAYFSRPWTSDDVLSRIVLGRMDTRMSLAHATTRKAKAAIRSLARRLRKTRSKLGTDISLTSDSSIRCFQNTLRVLTAVPGLHSERFDLARYYHYFRSRHTFFDRVLFWINEGYHRIRRPASVGAFMLLAGAAILRLLSPPDRPVSYLLNPVRLLVEVVLAPLPTTAIQILQIIPLRLAVLACVLTAYYSAWSVLVAFNRRFGFPRNISDTPT